jgi:uncharacterized protein
MNTKSSSTPNKPLLLPLMIVLWALAMSALVWGGGLLGWQIFRIAVVAVAAASVILLTLRFSRWGSVVSILLSTVAFTLAIVFGAYWYLKTGFSWRVAVGIVSFLNGVMLLVLGSRQLVTGISKWWLVLTIPLTVIIVPVLTFTMTQPVIATNIPRIALGKASPADYSLPVKEISFISSDGVNLGGWYIPSANTCAVVLRHGSGSNGADVLAQAAVLVKHGYAVLITDARGHGRSGGAAMDFGWYGDADIKGAVDYLVNEGEIAAGKIAVVGMSMGGEEAIGALAADSRIAVVIAEGATGRTDVDKAWYKDVYGFRGSLQMGLEWAEYSIADLLTGAKKPISLIKAAADAAPRPLLLITAGKVDDELYAAKYIKQDLANVTIWTVPGAGHTQGLSVAPADWENNVIGFLDKALGN